MKEDLKNSLEELVLEAIEEFKDLFLIDIEINLKFQKVFIILDSDFGLTIEKLGIMHKKIYAFLEKKNIFEENNFSLEVSSPGLDKPLKLIRQYKKNIGREVEVELMDNQSQNGVLTEVDEEGISIDKKNINKKNKSLEKIKIFFTQIKQTKLVVKI